jgi:hypothetical protein
MHDTDAASTTRTVRTLTNVYIHGWNTLALLWLAVGGATAVCVWFLLSLFYVSSPIIDAIPFGAAGLTMTCGDLLYRSQAHDSGPVWRFASPLAGGSAVLAPSWLLGIAVMVVAALFGSGLAN